MWINVQIWCRLVCSRKQIKSLFYRNRYACLLLSNTYFKLYKIILWTAGYARARDIPKQSHVILNCMKLYLSKFLKSLRIASRMGSNPIKGKPLFPWAKTLRSVLSTCWFQERIRECFYKLIALYTIELKYILYKLI